MAAAFPDLTAFEARPRLATTQKHYTGKAGPMTPAAACLTPYFFHLSC
jgi:hypothetical protein